MIVSYGKAGNSEGILDVLRSMSEKFSVVVQEETLREYAVPWLYKLCLKNSNDVISKLKSAGIPLESSVVSLLHYLLSENNIKDAVKVVKKYNVNYMPNSLRKPLLQAYRHTGDAVSFAGMMHAMYIATENIGMRNVNSNFIDEAFPVLDRFELVGQLLLDTVSGVRNVNVSEVKKLLEAMCSQGLVISTSTAERFVEQLGNANMTTEISNLLEKLTSGVVVSQEQRASQGMAFGSESRLTNLVNNLKAKGEPTHTARKRLLNLHCKNQNLEKANAVWQELVNEDVGIGPGLTAQLIDLNVSNENLETALKVLKWLENQTNDYIVNRSKIVKLATLLVKNNDLDGALTLLRDQAQKRTATTEEKNYALSSACRTLLNYLADQADVDNLRKAFDTLLQNSYIDINNVMLGPLIKVHIVRNDLDSAMKEFEKLCNMYRCTPMKNELTCKLIEAEDAVSLQKITDLSTKVHGEVNSLYDLVFAFVECGRVRQARKILETPGLLVRPERVHLACSRYSQEGMVSSLEGLVEATKSLSHIDPSNIYLHLLKTYCQKNDSENALGLWVKMQEENVQPTDEFLRFLGNFLKEQGLPVPFVLPEVPIQSKTNENKVIENFTTALQESNYSKALEILESMEEKLKCQVSKEKLSSLLKYLSSSGQREEVSKLLLLMLQLNKQPATQIFKTVVNQITSAGDILTLNLINEYLDESAKKTIAYDNNLCRAHEIAGAASEYLHTLDNEVTNAGPSDVEALAGKFPKSAMLVLLKNHPELHSHYQIICEKYLKKGIIVPMSILWIYHALEHQYSVADEVWNKYLIRLESVKYDPVCRFALQRLDLPLATYVVERLKESNIIKSSHGYAHSCVVDILLTNGKIEEAVEFVKKSKSVISYENLTNATRKRLEILTKERGISLESS
ncbi:hypothetical protein R5R35_008252 [Gryllus longicercus]|uniref:Leucine-rich PPR motif-containing protein, mitochondrial n=1 Tax=Gryllus longicercus TaxID=2509291 RepID=A0AAN9V595_9ORTH